MAQVVETPNKIYDKKYEYIEPPKKRKCKNQKANKLNDDDPRENPFDSSLHLDLTPQS
jgi:hypothetical protein